MRARRSAVLLAAILAGCGLAGCGFESPDAMPPPFADSQAGCAFECHGDGTSNAPPTSMSGATATTDVAVGAHREHLSVASTWHRQVECLDCHVVPAEVDAPGHRDGDNKAEVTFAMIAGPGAAWNGTTCTTSCHGSAVIGGAQPTPTWTRVDGSQSMCGSCHGTPPPAPKHPPSAANGCAKCHPTMEEGSTLFRSPASHINGTVEYTAPDATGGCTSCHGSTTAAPPKDLAGNTDPTKRGVGAHAAHLASSTWHRQMPCSSCHVVPLTKDAPGHLDGNNVAEVKFDRLNLLGTYATGTATCTNLYCHGTGQRNSGSVSWVATTDLTCTSCHKLDGTGMSGEHRKHIEKNVQCSQCHSTVINADRAIIAPMLHINGLHEVKLTNGGTYEASKQRCTTACHGPKNWIEDDDGRGGPGGGGGRGGR